MTDKKSAPQITAQNFNPGSLVARLESGLAIVESFATRVEQIEATIEGFVNTTATILRVFSPFLPAPIGVALQDLPEIEAEIHKLKQFIGAEYSQLQSFLGSAGTGGTLASGTALPDGAIRAQDIPAQSVGEFSAPVKPSTPAPDGMEWLLVDGAWALAQIPPKDQ